MNLFLSLQVCLHSQELTADFTAFRFVILVRVHDKLSPGGTQDIRVTYYHASDVTTTAAEASYTFILVDKL